jgi:hypothetical protein
LLKRTGGLTPPVFFTHHLKKILFYLSHGIISTCVEHGWNVRAAPHEVVAVTTAPLFPLTQIVHCPFEFVVHCPPPEPGTVIVTLLLGIPPFVITLN